MRFKFSSFLFFFLFCVVSVFGKPVDVLFCPYDTGDSTIVSRLLPDLEKASVAIAAFGRAAEIFKDNPNLFVIEGGSQDNRAQRLTEEALTQLKEKFQPRVVVAGMASLGQAQVLNAYNGEAETFAIYDNFDDPKNKDFIQPFLGEIGSFSGLLVPAEFLVAPFKALIGGKALSIHVVGQPALEEWVEVFKSTDTKELEEKLGLKGDEKVIVFAGGMDETYEDYLRFFVKSVAKHPDWKVYMTYHPKSDGSLEKRIVEEVGAKNVVVSNDIKTNVLATLAYALVCHKSSVCQQAFWAGAMCGYVAGEDYNNFLTQGDNPLVPKFGLEDQKKLLEFLESCKTPPTKETMRKNQELMKQLGVPTDATETIIGLLLAMVKK